MAINLEILQVQYNKARQLVLDEEVFGSLVVVATEAGVELRSFDPTRMIRPIEHLRCEQLVLQTKPEQENRFILVNNSNGVELI